MSKTTYTAEVRAQVMGALLAGQSISSCSREFKIPKGTISGWKNRGSDYETQKRDIGPLLVEYLRKNLEALTAQAEQFSKPDWLAEQSASELAILHGVMTDKCIRLMEAFSDV